MLISKQAKISCAHLPLVSRSFTNGTITTLQQSLHPALGNDKPRPRDYTAIPLARNPVDAEGANSRPYARSSAGQNDGGSTTICLDLWRTRQRVGKDPPGVGVRCARGRASRSPGGRTRSPPK